MISIVKMHRRKWICPRLKKCDSASSLVREAACRDVVRPIGDLAITPGVTCYLSYVREENDLPAFANLKSSNRPIEEQSTLSPSPGTQFVRQMTQSEIWQMGFPRKTEKRSAKNRLSNGEVSFQLTPFHQTSGSSLESAECVVSSPRRPAACPSPRVGSGALLPVRSPVLHRQLEERISQSPHPQLPDLLTSELERGALSTNSRSSFNRHVSTRGE